MTTVGAIGLTIGMLCFIVSLIGFNISQSIDNLTKEVKRLNDTNDKRSQPLCEKQVRCDGPGGVYGMRRMVRLENRGEKLEWTEVCE